MNNDSFEKLADIIKENNLCDQALDYLVEIKKALEEKRKLEKAFELACYELEEKDYKLFDLYDRLDTYYESKDRHEWKEYLLESVKDDE